MPFGANLGRTTAAGVVLRCPADQPGDSNAGASRSRREPGETRARQSQHECHDESPDGVIRLDDESDPPHFSSKLDQHRSIGLYWLGVRRIVHQPDLQSRPVREFDHPLQELRAFPRVVRAVVQIDYQPADRTQMVLHRTPPQFQAVRLEIAVLVRAENQRPRPGGHDQNAQGRPLPGRRRIRI